MSLIISVFCNEGIVLAGESRTTQTISTRSRERSFPFFDNARKLFAAPNGFGISSCGVASINGQPIAGYVERFIASYDYSTNHTVRDFANSLIEFFSIPGYKGLLFFHIAGYDRDPQGIPSTERLFKIVLETGELKMCTEISSPNQSGAIWDGVTEILSRLIKESILPKKTFEAENLEFFDTKSSSIITIPDAFIIPKKGSTVFSEATISWGLFSLQDAIDFARFGIQTTIDAQRFLSTEKTVGGPIEVLVIRPNGNEWISRKTLK